MKPLVINNWQTGIGDSPYLGFSQMTNVDVFTKPGALKISQKLTPSGNSAAVITGLIKWQVQEPLTGDMYAVDDVGELYKWARATDTWSVIAGHGPGAGQGLGIWKNYLFYARDNQLDVYGPLSGVPAWTVSWQSLTSPQYMPLHPIMAPTDDILYVGDAQYVSTFEEVTGQTFAPGNPATFTPNLQDLELGSQFQVTSLEELGSDIAVGTMKGLYSNIGNTFFWDGFSDSFSLNKTIHFAENGVWQMKNMGNVLYTVAGTGLTRFFTSTTGQATEAKRLNNLTLNNVLSPYVDAIDQKDGEVLFGVSTNFAGTFPMGVYSYRNGAYVLRHLISTGHDGTGGVLIIGSIKLNNPETYFVSWRDDVSSTVGVDVLSNNFYTGYTASVQTAVYQVATDDDPKTYEKCQIRLGKPLRTDDKVRIQARFDLNTSYTTVAEFLGTTFAASANKTVLDTAVKNLGYFRNAQFKIDLDIGAAETVSVELMDVTFT